MFSGFWDKGSVMRFQNIVILTGAGISAESGVRTFRDNGGLWENHRVEDVATPKGFANNPDLAQRFYNERRARLHTIEINLEPSEGVGYFAEYRHGPAGELVPQLVDELLG